MSAEEKQAALLANRRHVAGIFEAARDGRAADLRTEVEAYASSQLQDDGATPRSVLAAVVDANGRRAVHFAAKSGHLDACAYIAQTDPSAVRARDGDGLTPAILAAGGGYVPVLRLFYEGVGCDPPIADPALLADTNAAKLDGTTALSSAAIGGHAEVNTSGLLPLTLNFRAKPQLTHFL